MDNLDARKHDEDDDIVELVKVETPAKKAKAAPAEEDCKPSVAEKIRDNKATNLPKPVPFIIDLTVPWRPKPKRRPNKGHVNQLYNCSAAEEKRFRGSFEAQMEATYGRVYNPYPRKTPLQVELTFYYPKKKFHLHTTADVDNLAKLVLDSIQGVVYHNDNQVVELIARKAPSNDETGRTHVLITEVTHWHGDE